MDDIYLDNNSSTKPFASLIDQVMPFFKEYWASSTAPHLLGQQLHFPLMTSLAKIYETLGASPQDAFYFSSSGAEAINQVFLSTYLNFVRETGRTHFLTTAMEEAPFLWSLKRLEQLGCAAKTLPVNAKGQLTKEILEEAIRPRTSLVSLSWANGLTGVIHPILDLAEVCKAKEVLFHVDASTMIGKQFFRFQDMKVDFLTFDGSLFHAPRGVAGTFVRAHAPFSPVVVGNSNENIAGLVALSESLEMAQDHFEHLCTETARLRDKLEKEIQNALPDAKVWFQDVERLPNTTAIAFPGVSNEALLYALNTKGVYASMGGGSFQKLSHLLTSCGIEESLAHSSLSFSLSYETTEAEIDRAVQTIAECYKKLRQYSTQIVG